MMKNFFSLCLKTIFFISIFTCPQAWADSNAKPISYVFIQTADIAVLKVINKNNRTYTLTLKNVGPYIHFMSDRPNRIIGSMPINKFYDMWNVKGRDSFRQDAPNVSFEGIKQSGFFKQKSFYYLLSLDKPVYNSKKNEIIYQAKLLGDTKNNFNLKKITLNHAILFLDDWCPGCCC